MKIIPRDNGSVGIYWREILWDLIILWDFQHFPIPGDFLLVLWDSLTFVQTPPPPREVVSIFWDLQTKIINRQNHYSVFWRNKVSPHFSSSCGIPRDGEMFSCRGWGMVWKFQNGESFSPFLLISWDSVRFIQTQPPPQDFSSRYANADPIWVPWGKWVLRELEATVLHDDYEANLYGGGRHTDKQDYLSLSQAAVLTKNKIKGRPTGLRDQFGSAKYWHPFNYCVINWRGAKSDNVILEQPLKYNSGIPYQV